MKCFEKKWVATCDGCCIMCVNRLNVRWICERCGCVVVFTSKQVAQALNVSEETVRRWIRTGNLEAESLGKSYRISEKEIRRFLKTREVSYELTMFPKFSNMIETATRSGLNPAKIEIKRGVYSKKAAGEKAELENITDKIMNESGDENIFDTPGMDEEIETLITKMEHDLDILRKARKILQTRKDFP